MNLFQKSILLFFFGCFYFLQSVEAQTTLAKFKYEEAEKAYEEGNYKSALQLVDEVEKMIKSTSPKTLYLKILAKKKMGPVSFKEIQALRSDCSFFLEKYDNIEDNEDRYREVYEISKSLNSYPKSEEEFHAIVLKKELLKKQEEEFNKKVENYTLGAYRLRVGMAKGNIPKSLLSELKERKKMGDGYFDNGTVRPGFYSLTLDSDDRVSTIHTITMYGKNIAEISQAFESLSKEFSLYFGKDNVERKDSTVKGDPRWSSTAGDIYQEVYLKNSTTIQIKLYLTIDKDYLSKDSAVLGLVSFLQEKKEP